jgi:hypothetical protein
MVRQEFLNLEGLRSNTENKPTREGKAVTWQVWWGFNKQRGQQVERVMKMKHEDSRYESGVVNMR